MNGHNGSIRILYLCVETLNELLNEQRTIKGINLIQYPIYIVDQLTKNNRFERRGYRDFWLRVNKNFILYQ